MDGRPAAEVRGGFPRTVVSGIDGLLSAAIDSPADTLCMAIPRVLDQQRRSDPLQWNV